MKTPKNVSGAVAAFSLVEVAIALGVAAFCLVAIFGLFPVGLNTNQASIEQTAAANAAMAVRLDLQAMPKGTDPTTILSPLYKIPAPPSPLSNGGTTVAYAFSFRDDGAPTGTPVPVATPSSTPLPNTADADHARYRVTVTYSVPTNNQTFFTVPTRILVSWPARADPASTPPSYSGALEISTALLRE